MPMSRGIGTIQDPWLITDHLLGMGQREAGLPSRSTRMELPSSSEKPMSTQGRKGAWKVRPKKLTLT